MATKADVLKQLERIPDDEPLFLLRAQDCTAPDAIDDWAERAEYELTCPFTKSDGARVCAADMRDWQTAHPDRVKVPD